MSQPLTSTPADCDVCGKPLPIPRGMRRLRHDGECTDEAQRRSSREANARRSQGQRSPVAAQLARIDSAPEPEPRERLPATRGECAGGARPCPFVSCRHHLYLEVRDSGGLKLNFPETAPEDLEQLEETCSLDVADRGGMTLEEVGAVARSAGRERVRQIEEQALRKLRKFGIDLDKGGR